MTIKIGDKLPDFTFMGMGENGPEPVTTDHIFKGVKVALFAVPGAFTPTCSAKHLPSFKDSAQALRAKGIDAIACTSVNDIFVMQAWAQSEGVADDFAMLADGNGDFATLLGLELDASGFGMGQRSQRYAMVVNDGVVEALYVEAPGEYKVSSADYMLSHL